MGRRPIIEIALMLRFSFFSPNRRTQGSWRVCFVIWEYLPVVILL